MKNYSEYTIEELKSMIEEQRELIQIRECGNDFYYSSGQYDEDEKKISDIEFEIYFRETISEGDINKIKHLSCLCKLRRLYDYEKLCNEKIKELEDGK